MALLCRLIFRNKGTERDNKMKNTNYHTNETGDLLKEIQFIFYDRTRKRWHLIQVTAKWGDHIGRFDYINTEHAANAYRKP